MRKNRFICASALALALLFLLPQAVLAQDEVEILSVSIYQVSSAGNGGVGELRIITTSGSYTIRKSSTDNSFSEFDSDFLVKLMQKLRELISSTTDEFTRSMAANYLGAAIRACSTKYLDTLYLNAAPIRFVAKSDPVIDPQ